MIWRQNISDSVQGSRECAPSTARAGEELNDRGVALVITLLLLFLLSVIGLAAVLSSSSDLLINGYYSNYRGSFYAADSGLNIARQAMYTQLNNTFANDYSTFTTPPPADIAALADNGGVPGTISTYIRKYYGGIKPCPINPPSEVTQTVCYLAGVSNTATPFLTNSWSQSFNIVQPSVTFALAQGFQNPTSKSSCVPTPGVTLNCPTAGFSSVITSYTYTYNYSITSVGTATGSETSTITENGTFIVKVSGTPPTSSTPFSIYGAFVTNWNPCTLGWLVPGTMTGTMFTDGSWGFGGGGTYIFTDPVGQADPDASYWVDGCNLSPNSSYTAPDGETVSPQFQDGFQVNQTPITQPANQFSQEWAVLDGTGCGENNGNVCGNPTSPSVNTPQNSDLNTALKDINGNAYPPTGAASGVYLDYQNINGTLTMAGGGLFVQGNAQILLNATNGPAPNNDPLQVFTIMQGGTTTTMTIDLAANGGVGSTTVVSGGTTLTLMGQPANCSNFYAPPNPHATPPSYCTTVPSLTSGSTPGAMVYVNGTITSMTGPGQGVGAIQDGAAVTITALGDINITGDVIYKTEPVTVAPNQIPGTPVATLIPGSDHNQDLGIFTSNGNIILSSNYPNDNLQVDGSQAVIGANCASWSCGFLVNGCINVFNNVGGQIQTNIFGACLNVENTYFDRRYTSRPGFAPPWFPATTVTNIAGTTNPTVITPQRTSWVATSGQ
jgi:Tfp pilus assembly protein PilX